MAALFSPRSDRKLVIANTEQSFSERIFDIQQSIPPFPAGDWGSYCKAAVWIRPSPCWVDPGTPSKSTSSR
jgi:galactokinase